jgi:formylmethanofuran dehydrogenase subunit B
MAVARIGNRETHLAHAVYEAAVLLEASKCPVFLLDTDIHGARAAVSLAERIGAAYDLADSGAGAAEAALIFNRGAMTIAPGEARRRADVLMFVGPMPRAQTSFLSDLARSKPDLSGFEVRKLFALGAGSKRDLPEAAVSIGGNRSSLAATLATIRASLAGRQVNAKAASIEVFVAAMLAAVFPVFIYSGEAGPVALEMLQGLVADLNKTRRASTLHLPANEDGWGAVLASTWMTGFAPRTSFARGFPEFDPWRFDARRMIAAGEADLVLSIGSTEAATGLRRAAGPANIVLTPISRSRSTAAVTIHIGTPGIDHDTVRYSPRIGAIAASTATHPSDLPSASTVLNMLQERLRGKAVA